MNARGATTSHGTVAAAIEIFARVDHRPYVLGIPRALDRARTAPPKRFSVTMKVERPSTVRSLETTRTSSAYRSRHQLG
jgi:hypothetical protein